MAKRVKMADGSIQVFPDEATPEMIAEALGATFEPPPPGGKISDDNAQAYGAGQHLGNAVLVGGGIPLMAAANAAKEVFGPLLEKFKDKGLEDFTFEDRDEIIAAVRQFPEFFQQASDIYHSRRRAYQEQNPVTATALDITGSLPAGLTAGGMANMLFRATLPRAGARFMTGGAGYTPGGASVAGFGPLMARIASQGTAGAVQGAAGAGATAGLTDGDIEDELASGTAVGTVLGGTFGPFFSRLAQMFRSPAISEERARLAEWALDRGIPVYPWQVTNSSFRRGASDAARQLPFSGAARENEAQLGAFTRELAKTIGEDADTLSRPVLNRAATRIGQKLDDAAARSVVPLDNQFVNELAAIGAHYKSVLTPQEFSLIERQIDNIINQGVAGGGKLAGSEYQILTNRRSPLNVLMDNKNVDISQAGQEIREALDAALERGAAPDVVAQIREARSQWKNLRTLQSIAERSQPEGTIQPGQMNNLLAHVLRRNPNYWRHGAGDIGQLAEVGTNFIRPDAGSSLANQNMIRNVLLTMIEAGGAGAAVASHLMQNPAALAVALGMAAAPPVAGASRNAFSRFRGTDGTRAIIDRATRGRELPLLVRSGIVGESERRDQERDREGRD